MTEYKAHLISGAWQPASSPGVTVVRDSATEEPISSVASGSAAEVSAAVEAASRALGAWSALSVAARSAFVHAIANELEARTEQLVEGITAEVGMPLKLTRRIQVQAPIAAWHAAADAAEPVLANIEVGNSTVQKVPVGVVAAITPWNYPLHQITGKVAAALMAGCCVVLKPSELAPCAAQALGEAAIAAGLPAGVLNIVFGDKSTGEALVAHTRVDMVSFTGSTAVGRHLAATAGAALKRVALELGGKSAGVALPDADPAFVTRAALGSCMLNSGQTCSAITRLLVPAEQYDDYRERVKSALAALKVGDPREADTRVGPLVSQEQRLRVQSFIDFGRSQGYDVLESGVASPERGYFVMPVAFGKVPPDARLAQEEVFGPVLVIQTYESEDDAVDLANGTPYGLAAAVWGSEENALAVAGRIRAGQVDVNGAPFNPAAPFGGFGASGIGRENGAFGIEEFVELRSVQRPVARKPQ